MKSGSKTALIWIVLLTVVLAVFMQRNRQDDGDSFYLSEDNSLEWISAGDVVSYHMNQGELQLITYDGDTISVIPPLENIWEVLADNQIPHVPSEESSAWGGSTFATTLVIFVIILIAVLYFLRKMGGGAMNNIFELRKSKARSVEDVDKARFSDIGGNREAVATLADVVDFLNEPKRWLDAGTRLPRGILLVGPPGIGKTLLARAVAGETKAAFFYTSAAEFVEMFVGVGAARVRDTFEKAAAEQPAIVFIDELDAIGRRRGSGMGTMHEEREQSLNQLLVLMDGLERNERLVVMAATNRPDVLDPALLRSGRFDRMLRMHPPTREERVEILKVHVRGKPLDASVVLERIAEQTDGFTGADLESLTNDAALHAVRRNRGDATHNSDRMEVTSSDFDAALRGMKESNRQFDRLDSLLVESISQFAEPTGRAVARITLTTGSVVEGDVLWMNAAHIKLRQADGSDVIVAKEMAEQIVPLEGTEMAPREDVVPDRWAGRNLDVG